jgi:hypothetical protein
MRILGKLLLIAILTWVVITALIALGAARDDGRYAQFPLKQWFDSLHSKKGYCCSDADGQKTDYEISVDGAGKRHYAAPIDGVLTEVPDDAVLDAPNRTPEGSAMKWIYIANGRKQFKCFLPAAGA